jgi:catechol 2,3-dioxygenase-like lactoylglutathione lyase family enzyme
MLVGGLSEVILTVEDMDAQVRFYRDSLGLEVLHPATTDDLRDASWVTFATGSCVLALHGGGRRRFGEDAPRIVFDVPDVAAARAELLRRGVAMGEERTPAPGVVVCDARDAEGNVFSIEQRAA